VAGPVVVEGMGLHTGEPCRVVLLPRPGPVSLRVRGVDTAIRHLVVASTVGATTVRGVRAEQGEQGVQGRSGGPTVGTVEHVFAALAGLGVYDGLALDVLGPEMPLLDGCASAWCDAIARAFPSGLPAAPPSLRVTRAARFEVGPSRFELAPGDGIDVRVRFEVDDPRLDRDASWQGEAGDFVARIAPARTFVLARDLDDLARRGLARHVDPACVVVVTPDGLLTAGRAPSCDEPVRHKLLDLIGDLYLAGGPPLGHFHAVRPGHAANAHALRLALEEGVLVSS
jgi:UDP-3-O-[3-hydroxymyristoyl] N-acetylglucosamine deacetylase